MSIWQSFINLILPPRCAICGKILALDKGICDECIENIDFLRAPICRRCGRPVEAFEHDVNARLLCGDCIKNKRSLFRLSRSAFAYDDFSKKLILDFKFHDHTNLASLLAKMMYVAGKDIFNAGVDVIIPVPLHYTRLIKRKYNQSALLAKELSRLTDVKAEFFALIKVRRTKPQVECDGNLRLNNLKGAFAVKHESEIKGKRVLLIDDVLTTGSTLKECAGALKLAGAKSIDSLTVARVLH